MADIVDVATRSRMMSGIRSKNTRPEIRVRTILHKLGFRFRIHSTALAGRPDIVLPRFKALFFVNGCFWHGHDCHLFRWPASRIDFWKIKVTRNQENDRKAIGILQNTGWRTGTIWECALKGRTRLVDEEIADALASWLRSDMISLDLAGSKRENM